jgi:hypothetical protein
MSEDGSSSNDSSHSDLESTEESNDRKIEHMNDETG